MPRQYDCQVCEELARISDVQIRDVDVIVPMGEFILGACERHGEAAIRIRDSRRRDAGSSTPLSMHLVIDTDGRVYEELCS